MAAFDPQGLVFAVATNGNEIRMYDFKEYTNGPFATWVIADPQYPTGQFPEWTSLKFTADGKQLVITTITDLIYILDSFNGNLLQRLVGHTAPDRLSCGEEVCITPDAGFLVAGGKDSYLRIWDLKHKGAVDNQPFATLPTPHKNGINIVGYNPLNAMSVSGGEELVSRFLYFITKKVVNFLYSIGILVTFIAFVAILEFKIIQQNQKKTRLLTIIIITTKGNLCWSTHGKKNSPLEISCHQHSLLFLHT